MPLPGSRGASRQELQQSLDMLAEEAARKDAELETARLSLSLRGEWRRA